MTRSHDAASAFGTTREGVTVEIREEPSTQQNIATQNDGDEWLSGLRQWKATRRPRPVKRKRRKPGDDREQGPMAALLTVYGVVLGALFVFGYLLFTAEPAATDLELLPDQLPPTAVGSNYNVEIYVLRGASPLTGASVTAGTLPPGLALVIGRNEFGAVRDIRISGNPTTAATYDFTLEAFTSGTDIMQFHVDAQGGSHEYVIVVN